MLLLTGCTTAYKVDEKNVCRAPNGKIVNVADVDPDRIVKKISGKGWCGKDQMYGYAVRLMSLNNGGTCYGW